MIWIILFFVSFSLILLTIKYDWEESVFGLSVIVCIPSAFLGGYIFVTGLAFYSDLVSVQKKVQSLEQHVMDIKSAFYEESSSNHVADLVNFKQSTTLSEYMKLVAIRKADYNANLAKAKLYRSNTLYRWLWVGMFIPEDVMQMEFLP